MTEIPETEEVMWRMMRHRLNRLEPFRGRGMRMPRLLTLVVLGIAVVSSICEATSKRIQVTAQVVQTAFTGDPNDLRLGD
jgi:hypothetical protein